MIHMRFVKDGKITGYGCAHCETGYVSYAEWIAPNLSRASYPCDLIERGIEVRDEVWYEGDLIRAGDGDGVIFKLKWMDVGFYLVYGDHPDYRVSFWFDDVCLKRIGNIHEGERE